jgi:hypothetical protein
MKPTRTLFLNLLVMAALTLLSSGCTAPKFSPVGSIPNDKALVYIYRKAALGGIAGNHHIFANGHPVTSLYSGSYYPYLATAGTNIFSSQMISPSALMNLTINAISQDEMCRLDAQPGQTYYVQFKIATTWGPKIVLVDNNKGLNDIQNCHLAKPLKSK